MTAPLDLTPQSAALDAMLGDGKAAGMPSAFELALFDGDPRTGGLELASDGGYGRATGITNNSTNFPDAVDGVKDCAEQTFPTATDAWSDTAIWFVFFDAADHTTRWWHGPLDDEVSVTDAGTVVHPSPTIYWDQES